MYGPERLPLGKKTFPFYDGAGELVLQGLGILVQGLVYEPAEQALGKTRAQGIHREYMAERFT
jgi:hypothetical protein